MSTLRAVSRVVRWSACAQGSTLCSRCRTALSNPLVDPRFSWDSQSKHEFRTMGLVEYFCQCKTTVDATSGACQAEGWQVTANFQDTCGSVDTLTTGAAMMMIGEVVAASLVVIMFGDHGLPPNAPTLTVVSVRPLFTRHLVCRNRQSRQEFRAHQHSDAGCERPCQQHQLQHWQNGLIEPLMIPELM